MRKFLLVIALLVNGMLLFAQDSLQTHLELRWSTPLDPTSVWDNDDAGNVYLFRNQAISKLDTTGKQLLTQSAKSFGQLAKIDASNWMKIAVFSEEQQQICYLDNALGLLPGCIELSELGVNLAQNFSVSAQTDRIWVYDQLNSELQIITLRSNQRQIVQNLSGLAEISNVVSMTEYENKLFLLDSKGRVLFFDNFGSLLDTYDVNADCFFPTEQQFFLTKGNNLFYENPDRLLFIATIPVDGTIRQFAIVHNHLLVSTEKNLYSFRFTE